MKDEALTMRIEPELEGRITDTARQLKITTSALVSGLLGAVLLREEHERETEETLRIMRERAAQLAQAERVIAEAEKRYGRLRARFAELQGQNLALELAVAAREAKQAAREAGLPAG
jgi:hypothetical protein